MVQVLELNTISEGTVEDTKMYLLTYLLNTLPPSSESAPE